MKSVAALIASLFFSALFFATMAQAQEACTPISGVSGESNSNPNAGVIDFEYGQYLMGEDRVTQGALIAEDYRVCVDAEGKMGTTATDNAFAWNNNVGWLDFAWCVGTECSDIGQPQVDVATGYWSGYVWSEKIGWIWLDWNCPSCDTSLRVRSDLTTGVVSGYGWSDSLGWIDFGGASWVPPVSEVTGYVFIEVTPDPITATKVTAPLADGEDGYKVGVQVFVPATETEPAYFLSDDPDGDGTPDYEMKVTMTPTSDSRYCWDQISMTCTDTEAVYFPDIYGVYDETSEMWWVTVHAYAPSSNVNGYDEDNDGVIDYYFDLDPDDPMGIARSSAANRFELESVNLSIAPLTASAPDVVWDSTDPLYNLNDDLGVGDPYEFKFAPPIEVANLERDESGSLVAYISSVADVEQYFKGLVVKWSTAAQFSGDNFEFKVGGVLNVETDAGVDAKNPATMYQFLFDNQPAATLGDGAYTHSAGAVVGVTPDSSEFESKFIISNPGGADPSYAEYLDKFIDYIGDSRTVYVEQTDYFKPLWGGHLGDIPESGMIVPGPSTVDPEPSSPRYETYIAYFLPNVPTTKGVGVWYYSNYLPQAGSTLDPENVGISGSVTSSTDSGIDIESVSSGDVVVLGDVATASLRNELFKRFSELTKGITPASSGSDGEVSGALELNESLGGIELLDGTLLYFKDQDVHVSQSSDHAPKTIVVWGGNVYVDSDLSDVGIVAFQNASGEGGHVYIGSDVIDVVEVNIFADHAVSSYDFSRGFDANGFADWLGSNDRAELLKHQLYFKGNIVSLNTLYGSDESLSPNYILANGQTSSDLALAKEYDLNRLREFSLCWIQVDILGNPVDYDGDGSTESAGDPDLDDVEPCAGAQRSSNIDSSSNVPVYFEYSPPSSELPILGESEAGRVDVF